MGSFQDLVDQVGQIAGPEEPFDDPGDDLLSDEAIQDRKHWIIAAGSELFYDRINRKGEDFPTVLCRLYQDPEDGDAWNRVEGIFSDPQEDAQEDPQEDPPASQDTFSTFTLNVLARIYYQFFLGTSPPPDHMFLSPEFEEAITSFPYLTKGTENTAAMKYTSGYLFGKALSDRTFAPDNSGTETSGTDLTERCKEFTYHYGQKLFKSGMREYLSPAYHGVNTAAWLNMVDFAGDEDREGKDMARAILDWMLADYALNYHHGLLLPPLERYTGTLTTNKYLLITNDEYAGNLNAIQRSFAYTRGQWTGWLYWGGGNTPQDGSVLQDSQYALQIPHGMDAIRHAVSGYVPPHIIRNIGAKRVKTPYMVWQSHGNLACLHKSQPRKSQQNRCGDFPSCECQPPEGPEPRYRMRSAYVARGFGMGVLYRRKDLGDPENRVAGPLISVAWESRDPLNWLIVVHPYWHTARERRLNSVRGDPVPLPAPSTPSMGGPLGSYDWVGASPFGQAVHWENACVAVFDIPERDPYRKNRQINAHGSPDYYSYRVDPPIQAVYVYFPDTVDLVPAGEPEVFLIRTGRKATASFPRGREVYIAVRPFYYRKKGQARIEPGGHAGFRRLAIPGGLVGLAVEVGSSLEYRSLREFGRRISKASLDLSCFSRSHREVTYESTRGHVLRIRHTDDWLPEAWVNGTLLEFDSWPVYQSPYVTCRDRVLDVNDGRNGFTITWDGDVPQRREYQVQV